MAVNLLGIQERDGVDAGHRPVSFSSGPILQEDGVRSPGHGMEVSVLEGGNPGIGRKSVEKSHFKQDTDIGE